MTLSKIKIEEMVNEIQEFLKKYEMLSDVCFYFNNKRYKWERDWSQISQKIYNLEITENISPLDYFEYINHEHILSMSFEGDLYDILNGYTDYAYGLQDKFNELLEKYGLYYELGNSWNLSLYPINDDMEIEYTLYKEKPEPTHIHISSMDILPELKNIMVAWYELSKKEGDKGSCVLGAGFSFKYKNTEYFMSACSPYQGSVSWETHIGTVREMLERIGATNINYKWGWMD